MSKSFTPSQHSEFSPSGSSRWIPCPGSIQAIRSIKKIDKPNLYAEEGTAAHELAAKVITFPYTRPHDYLKEHIYTGHKKWYVDAEMANAVEEYMNHVLAYTPNPESLRVETRVSLEHLHDNTFGTSDATIVDHEDGTIHVMDYKHGRGVPVEAENNTQLMLYAVGTLVGLHNEGIKLSNFHTVSLHIVQPRCPHPEGPVRIWHTTVKDLQAFSKEAKKAIINACSNDPDFAAGDKQCKWCEFAAMCPTLAKFSLEVAQNEFKDFAIVESDIKDIERLTNEQISGLLQHTKVIEHWIKSLVTYAQNELEQGNSFPDYKLVRGRANRIWDDGAEKKVLEAVKDLEDFDKDALYSVPKFRTPAQIEKELGKQKDIIQKFIVKPLGKITIAHNSDKRASVSPTQGAEDDFAVLADKIDS